MIGLRQTFLGIVITAAVAALPTTQAMANGHGFRAGHGFGVGHGLFGAALALATLPLVVASNVVAGVSESVAPYQGQRYVVPSYPRPYYAPYPPYYGGRPGYGGRAYYRAGGQVYPRR